MGSATGHHNPFSVGTECDRVCIPDCLATDIEPQLFLLRDLAIGENQFC